jgi:hypothetical protein
MYDFDEAALVAELRQIDVLGRAAFALAAATRQIGNWEWYARQFDDKNLDVMRQLIEQLWTEILAAPFDPWAWSDMAEQLETLVPRDDGADEYAVCHALAEDAMCSLIYAIRCLGNGEPQEAGWAARRAYDSTDQAVLRILGGGGDGYDETAIISHLIVQRELSRQRRDIALLLGSCGVEIHAWETLRSLAFAETSLTAEEQGHPRMQSF